MGFMGEGGLHGGGGLQGGGGLRGKGGFTGERGFTGDRRFMGERRFTGGEIYGGEDTILLYNMNFFDNNVIYISNLLSFFSDSLLYMYINECHVYFLLVLRQCYIYCKYQTYTILITQIENNYMVNITYIIIYL